MKAIICDTDEPDSKFKCQAFLTGWKGIHSPPNRPGPSPPSHGWSKGERVTTGKVAKELAPGGLLLTLFCGDTN